MRKEASQPLVGARGNHKSRPDKKETGEGSEFWGAKTERVHIVFYGIISLSKKKHTAMLAPLAQ